MFVHGDNLKQKENHQTKYRDPTSKAFLVEIRNKYDEWHEANTELKGPYTETSDDDFAIIKERVSLFNEYKDFIDQQQYAEKFDSRSNLHSSVLEEFIYYMFRDMVEEFSTSALIGKCHSFKDIFFDHKNYKEMIEKPKARIETKDHDFVIGASINAELKCNGSPRREVHSLEIPAVSVECKTYLDKTMLEGASNAAAQLKSRNPNAICFVVAEWLKLTENVNLSKYKVDQIYVLRKQKNTDREYRYLDGYEKNPIYADVVDHLFTTVRNYLSSDWEGGITYGLEKGFLL